MKKFIKNYWRMIIIRVSVVTITYNRKKELLDLYNSLLKQTDKNFDWVIVDDGSNDLTDIFIEEIIEQNKLSIEFLQKKNGGKHSGINYFLDNSKLKNELVFFVDSDDILIESAVERIRNENLRLLEKEKFSGLCFLKLNKDTGKPLCKLFPKNKFDSNIFEIIKKYKIYGDKAEVFFLKELSKHRFPLIENEKFISELYIWMELSRQKKMRYINEGIYLAAYLENGYTKSFNKLLYENPLGMTQYYLKLFKEPKFGYLLRVRALARIIQIKIMRLK